MTPEVRSGFRLGPRERLVLTAVIELYIASGEPVASHAIARLYTDREGMSSATIRNVMATLSDAGLLEQPHTSAGRVPTAPAFRFYVEHLAAPGRALSGQLSAENREQIEGCFAGVSTREQFLERTSHILALVSSGVGLAAAMSREADALEHIHFSRLGPGRALAVLVTRGGAVLDRVLQLDRDLPQPELEAAANFLNGTFRGWPVDRIRAEVVRTLERERNEYDQLMRSVDELCSKGALDAIQGAQTIFVEGVANLVQQNVNHDRLRQLLSALEAKQRILELLNAYVDARQQAVRVVVGLGEAMPEMEDMVLIGAGARLGSEGLGALAVLAPTRIRYQETIQTVSYIAQLSERVLPLER